MPTSTMNMPAHAAETADPAETLLRTVECTDVEIVRFLWVDHNGIIRGKGVSRALLADRLRTGVGLASVRQSASLSDRAQPVPGFRAMEEVRVAADPSTFVPLPYAPGSAAVLCDLVNRDRSPWGACPRTFLREAVARYTEIGFDIVAAFEPEFTLLRDGAPLDDSLMLDGEGFDVANDFVVSLIRALRAADITVEQYHPEASPGQHEVTLRPAPALRAADHHVWQRAFTRGVARTHGLRASFAPVPLPGLRGNGNHVHVSLWQGDNAFCGPGGGLSEVARHFIGGVLAHLPGLTALLCPSVNSYERLVPGNWAGAFGCYGPDNRDAAIRVPSPLRGAETATTNVEVKLCDATANPYLALGAILHAGLDGLEREIDPGEPLAVDPNLLSAAELGRRGVFPLPRSLAEATDALERDELLMSALGSPRRELYTTIKRADVRDAEAMAREDVFALHARRF
ncbi:glutamine synthetase family protein [Streptomyces sp. bgisy091]|uniref:glutamine synthetase family protein n=1 Tax=Streptomyces sp. bgisy091 TaxID=3413778 RepID=UPI003D72BDCE